MDKIMITPIKDMGYMKSIHPGDELELIFSDGEKIKSKTSNGHIFGYCDPSDFTLLKRLSTDSIKDEDSARVFLSTYGFVLSDFDDMRLSYEDHDGYNRTLVIDNLRTLKPSKCDILDASTYWTCCGVEIEDLESTLGLCPECKEHI